MASSAPIIISSVPASKHQQGRRGGRPAAPRRPPPPGAHIHKEFGWVGVRPRTWGGFAAEIRIPSSRSRVWIGKFQCALQAALAYDAAMFCFYGEDLPKMRKYNLPAVPRPVLPADARRTGLTVATVKAIAEKHARTFGAGFVTPQMLVPAAPPAPPAPPLPAVVPGATVAGGAWPVAVAAGDVAAAAGAAGVAVAAAGAGPSATVDGNAGNKEIIYIDAELMSNEDLEFSCNPEDLARVMGVDLVDLIFGDDF